MKSAPFYGVCAAIATPMKSSGEIDLSALSRLIEYQIEGGIRAITVCGTTGEASTLSAREMHRVIGFTVETVRGRVPVIAGAGSNDTGRACMLSESAEAAGADALLSVTPYYNKATPQGLFRHYEEISKSSSLPIILYNVPSRTSLSIPLSVYGQLAKIPSVVGLKEASGDVEYASEFLERYGDLIHLYSGCDALNLPLYSLGASGAISVTANIRPKETESVYDLFVSGKTEEARTEHFSLSKLNRLLFLEPNPIPLKAALSVLGLCENSLRLPLTAASEETFSKLNKLLSLRET